MGRNEREEFVGEKADDFRKEGSLQNERYPSTDQFFWLGTSKSLFRTSRSLAVYREIQSAPYRLIDGGDRSFPGSSMIERQWLRSRSAELQ
jgi:hypothetical protein